jgi:hypothetical protein
MAEQANRGVKTGDLFWTVCFVLMGVYGLGLFGYRLLFDASSARWPTTEGTVTGSAISVTYDSEGSPTYEVTVAYEYRVDDMVYHGERVSAVRTIKRGSREAAEDALLAYQPGSAVIVSYHPRNPQQAALETGVRWMSWLGVNLSLAWAGGWAVHLARLKQRWHLERSAAR